MQRGKGRGREENHVCSHHLIRMNKRDSDSGDNSEMIWKVKQKTWCGVSGGALEWRAMLAGR